MTLQQLSAFDLDHTLLQVNSSFHFARHLQRFGIISTGAMAYLTFCYVLHKAGILSIQQLQTRVFQRFFQGRPADLFERHAELFVQEQFSKITYTPAVDRLNAAKHNGHKVLILSSSPDFLVKTFAKAFGVQTWAGTEYLLNAEAHYYSIGKWMLSDNKVDHLLLIMHQLGIHKQQVTAYSDSILDLSFLQAAGTPVGVNPDHFLRRLCKKNQWTIL